MTDSDNLYKLRSYFYDGFTASDTENAIKMIEDGADIHFIYGSAKYNLVSIAAYHYNFDMVKYLILRGADVTHKNSYKYNCLELLYEPNMIRSLAHNNCLRWLFLYENKKLIIDKYPTAILDFLKFNQLNRKIKKEYDYLISSLQLNLL